MKRRLTDAGDIELTAENDGDKQILKDVLQSGVNWVAWDGKAGMLVFKALPVDYPVEGADA